MSKVGILGGTFDPIHLGHLITAQAVKEIRNLNKIIFIPNYVSPFKQEKKTSEAEHRLNMLELAIDGIPYFEISDLEIKKPGISYTIDTLKHFKNIYDNIELIIGYDNLADFDKWKDSDGILKTADVIVLKRKTNISFDKKNKYYNSVVFVDSPSIEISATEIRERVRNNLPINFLVPEKVKEYIYNLNIYKEKN